MPSPKATVEQQFAALSDAAKGLTDVKVLFHVTKNNFHCFVDVHKWSYFFFFGNEHIEKGKREQGEVQTSHVFPRGERIP